MMAGQYKLLGTDKLVDKKEPTLSRMKSRYSMEDLARVYYNIAYLRKILNGD